MADNNEATNFATAGSGKSPEEVAFDLVSKLKGQGVWGERNMPEILNMYAECLDATRGMRAYPGQNRVDAPVTIPESRKAERNEEPAPVQQTAAPHDIAQAVHAQPVAEPQAAPAQPTPNHTFNHIG